MDHDLDFPDTDLSPKVATLSPMNIRRIDTLEYMSDMLTQMRKLALSQNETRLAYLIELAMMEAQLKSELERFGPEIE